MSATITATPTTSAPHRLTDLSVTQRWGRALQALAHVMQDPERTDEVIVFSHYANAGTTPARIDRFFATAEGRQLFAEHRSIDSQHVDLDKLAALPTDTLGYAYALFLRSRGFTPDVFQAPDDVEDPRVTYVIQRIRQSHDLWHVVTGHTTDPDGEIALQAFTYGQLGAPSSLILTIAGTLRNFRDNKLLGRDAFAAYRRGRAAKPMAAFPWEDHWATPLATVRDLLGVEAVGDATPMTTRMPAAA
jgi:ubiquinone biosynthesis protein COQ4